MEKSKSLSDLYHYDLLSYIAQQEGLLSIVWAEYLRLCKEEKLEGKMLEIKRMMEASRRKGVFAKEDFERRLMELGKEGKV